MIGTFLSWIGGIDWTSEIVWMVLGIVFLIGALLCQIAINGITGDRLDDIEDRLAQMEKRSKGE